MGRPVTVRYLVHLLFVFALLLSGCSRDGKIDQSMESALVQGMTSALPSQHRLQNLPGHFSATVIGKLEGDHWDPQGRRYVPQLMLACSQRESAVRLLFMSPGASSMPLPARGALRVDLALDGGAARDITLSRNVGSYTVEGKLPLVHELLNASQARIETLTADRKRLVAHFDLRGLKQRLPNYDFYCASQWLADASPQPSVLAQAGPALPAQVSLGSAQRQRLESLRGEVAALEGVLSALWMPDTSLVIVMSNPSLADAQRAVQRACNLMRNYPEARPEVQLQDIASSTGAVTRMACPR